MPDELRFIARSNPIHRVHPDLFARLIAAQRNALDAQFPSARDLYAKALADLKIAVSVPASLADRSASDASDQHFADISAECDAILRAGGVPLTSVVQLAPNVAQRIHVIKAFEDPDRALRIVAGKVLEVARRFPARAEDIDCGKNAGDVLDPYIVAATQTLLFQGDFSQAMGATVAHKAIMMIEDLLGHLHEDVIGEMRGNVRVPEPRGSTNQEILDPFTNPFPGADVVQPPQSESEMLRFHQVKSKTGSAKGGDGKRLGEQLRRLQQHYQGDIYYDALIGNTLRGHRSMPGARAAAPELTVLVGAAAFRTLTRSKIGAELLLRVYQAAFAEVAARTGYTIDKVVATIVTTFKARADAEGEGFLESVLRTSTGGNPVHHDSRTYVPAGRARRGKR